MGHCQDQVTDSVSPSLQQLANPLVCTTEPLHLKIKHAKLETYTASHYCTYWTILDCSNKQIYVRNTAAKHSISTKLYVGIPTICVEKRDPSLFWKRWESLISCFNTNLYSLCCQEGQLESEQGKDR